MLLLALALAAAPTSSANDAYVLTRQAALYDIELRLREDTPALAAPQLAARTALLDALRTYADAGVFPHNHTSHEPIPFFIDEHGTHCAVASMLQASGREDLARAIADEDNALRLPTSDPRVVAWANEHGFTMDELASIQEVGYDETPREHVLTLTDPTTPTTLSKADVLMVVKGLMPRANACAGPTGSVSVSVSVSATWTIAANGRPTSVVTDNACLKKVLESARFPRATAATPVRFPFKLTRPART